MSGAMAMRHAAVFRASADSASDVRNNGKSDVTGLTRAMVRGEEAAWVQFHTEYSGRLHRYLLVLFQGDLETAGEVLQTTLTRVVRHIRQFDDEAVLWHWLTRVTRTAAIDELRKRGRRDEALRELADTPPPSSPDGELWPDILRQALVHLTQSDADLLQRKYVDGCSVRELAAAGAISEKALESRLTRAREKLREAIVGVLKHEE